MIKLSNFGPVRPDEIIESAHLLEWRTPERIYDHICEARGRISWATQNAFPGTSLLTYVELPTRKSLKYYGMTGEDLPGGIKIETFDNHFQALLKSAAAHKLLNFKRASLMPQQGRVDPLVEIDDSCVKEHAEMLSILKGMYSLPSEIDRSQIRSVQKAGTSLDLSSLSTEKEVQIAIAKAIADIENYGIGNPYYQLTQEGLKQKQTKSTSQKAGSAQPIHQNKLKS